MTQDKTLPEERIRQVWLAQLRQYRAIAVIRSPDPELGLQMAQAVAAGGIRLIEITWDSQQAAEVIRTLRNRLPHCWIGTGTILTLADLKQAIAAGGQFCFTPHVNPTLIETALAAATPVIPGALTPTEIVTAWQAGASSVKVFPIQAVGGVSYIQSLQGPLGEIPLIPTGGVTIENASAFLQAGAIAVGLSGQLFPKQDVALGNWAAIGDRARQLMQQLP